MGTKIKIVVFYDLLICYFIRIWPFTICIRRRYSSY